LAITAPGDANPSDATAQHKFSVGQLATLLSVLTWLRKRVINA